MSKSLLEIIIPNTVVHIESLAWFNGCDSLADIYFCGSEEEWNNIETESWVFKNKRVHFNHKLA